MSDAVAYEVIAERLWRRFALGRCTGLSERFAEEVVAAIKSAIDDDRKEWLNTMVVPFEQGAKPPPDCVIMGDGSIRRVLEKGTAGSSDGLLCDVLTRCHVKPGETVLVLEAVA